jgi:hypothetical protein
MYPSLRERNRAQNRRKRGSAPDRRSESHNRRNGVRSDSEPVGVRRKKKRVFWVFIKRTVLLLSKRTVSFIYSFLYFCLTIPYLFIFLINPYPYYTKRSVLFKSF